MEAKTVDEVWNERYDNRSRLYLNTIKNNIGLIGQNSGEELGIHEILKKLGRTDITPKKIWDNDGQVLYEYTNGATRYMLENWVRYGIDGFACDTYIFEKKPSIRDCETILKVNEIENNIKFGRQATTYTCWECGNKVHWLDNLGKGIEEKADRAHDSFCGHCDCEI